MIRFPKLLLRFNLINPSKLRTAALAAVLLLFAAPAFSYRMIGTEAEFIERAGFTDDAQVIWHGMAVHPKSVRSEFFSSEDKIIYFMVFRNLKYLRSVRFKAEWIDPSGQTRKKDEFTQRSGTYNIATVEFLLRGAEYVSLTGKWRLRIYEDNGEMLVDRAFLLSK